MKRFQHIPRVRSVKFARSVVGDDICNADFDLITTTRAHKTFVEEKKVAKKHLTSRQVSKLSRKQKKDEANFVHEQRFLECEDERRYFCDSDPDWEELKFWEDEYASIEYYCYQYCC